MGRLLLSCCRTRASGRFSCFLVHVSSCQLVDVQGVPASYDEYTALVKSGKVQSYRGTGVSLVQLWRPMWRRVSSEQQSDIANDLSRNLECSRHAIVEPSCRGVLRSLTRFRAVARVGAVFVVFPSSVVSSVSVCGCGPDVCCAALDTTCSWLKALSKVQKSSCRSHPS